MRTESFKVSEVPDRRMRIAGTIGT